VIRYLILKEKFKDGILIVKHVTEGREDQFTDEYQIILEIHPTNLETFLYFCQKNKRYQVQGVQTLDLQPEHICCVVQTEGTARWLITPTQIVASGQTTRSLSPSSVRNAEISTPCPLRPTPLAFSLPHQHRQQGQATSQNTEHIPLLHRQPQHWLWQANRTLEQWASSEEVLNRTKQWEDQWQERRSEFPSHQHLNHQHPLPSGLTLPTN
jgi:hypothetical protein